VERRYPGTLLVAIQDHNGIDQVATRIWNFD